MSRRSEDHRAVAPTFERVSGTSDTELVERTDSFEHVLKQVVRSPQLDQGPAAHMLSPGDTLASRFRIERVLGAGGMGTVYLARDPALDRRVAIKLHHAASGAERLRREGVAMARLAHPNVVTVFEVGELERRPFVVMEYVVGTTLRTWLARAPRTPAQIIDVMIAAGEGLAAAHDAGLVHRDIKPENVLIGADGRPRVGDFGLARDRDSGDSAARVDPEELLLSPVTRTGSVLGTPAYMAPEQFEGAVVDARADQFAFCVTLWEALWGARPFAGSTVTELQRAVAAGVVPMSPAKPRVPRGVRRVLARGLAPAPSQRYASMRALLAELRAARAPRRGWIAATAGAAFTIGAIAVAVVPGSQAVACDVAGSEYVQLIPRDLGDRLRAAGAEESASVVEHAVAAFTADLQRHARTACETGRMQHSWSPELVARSEACLANAAQVAQHVLRATELTPETIPSLVERTQQLPALAPCVDVAYLGALPVLPADPERRAAVVAARAELEIAISDLGVFELAAAKQRLDRIAGSPAHDEPTIAAGLLIARGWLATTDDHLEEAEKLVSDGYYAARAADDDDLATKALTKLLILGITHRLDPNKAKIWQRIAVADARRLETRAPWLAASILLCAARVADDAGAADDALAYLTQADRLIPPDDPGHVEVWMIEGAVKMWSGKVDEGVELYDRAIAAATKTLGPDHPRIAAMLIDSAASLLNTGRYQAAVVAAERAMEIASAAPDTGSGLLDLIRENLGAALIEVKRTDEARVLLEQARASYVQSVGEESPQVAHIDTNLAAIYLAAHEPARAIASLEAALATTEKLLGPDRVEVANVLQNLAAARRDAHDLRRALADARRCVAIYAATTNGSDPHRLALALGAAIANDLGDPRRALELTATALGFAEPPQDPASTASPQLERARALIALGRTDEARPLLASAREIYGNVGEPSKVGMVDNLMAKLR